MELSLSIGRAAASLSRSNRHNFLAEAAIAALDKVISKDPDSRPITRLQLILEQVAITAKRS